MKTVTAVSSNILAGMCNIAPAGDVRSHLNGIYTEPETGILVATDGHAMLVHRTKARVSDVAPFIIPRTLIEACLKAKPKAVRVLIEDRPQEDKLPRKIYLEYGVLHGEDFTPNGATFPGVEGEGRYPDWRRPIPLSPSGIVGQFNPTLLARVHQAIAEMHGEGRTTKRKTRPATFVHVTHNGEAGGALVTCPYPETLGLLMPMRGIETSLPLTLETLGLAATEAPEEQSAAPALAA